MRNFLLMLLMACGFGSFAAPPDGLPQQDNQTSAIQHFDLAATPDAMGIYGTSYSTAVSTLDGRTEKSFDVVVPPDEGLTTTNNFSNGCTTTANATHDDTGDTATNTFFICSEMVLNESDSPPDIGSTGLGMQSMTDDTTNYAWTDLPFTVGWQASNASTNHAGTQIRTTHA